MKNINFIEWDAKHRQYLIRLAGDEKSQETRLEKMKAAEDMYKALKEADDMLARISQLNSVVDNDGDFHILQIHIQNALALAEGKAP
jgi:uncharacterized protein YutE (UPF0331/DUF86 family)